MLKIGIDVGHGGTDSGAVDSNFVEKIMNLKVALYLMQILKFMNIEVVMTRVSDVALSLSQRCKILNDAGVSFVISIHHNAGKGDGFEIYHSINGGKGKVLAENIAKYFRLLGQNDHGTNGVKTRLGSSGKTDYYTLISDTNAPSIITEFAYIDNVVDRKAIDEEFEYENEAKAIAKGLCDTLGISYKEKQIVKIPEVSKVDYVRYILAFQKFYNSVTGTTSPIKEDGVFSPQTSLALTILERLLKGVY